MLKIKTILIGALLSTSVAVMATTAKETNHEQSFETTCKETNQGLPFRQVVLGHGEVRCDYGKDYDFEHSYSQFGSVTTGRGFWQGGSGPGEDAVFCRSGSSSCTFYLIPNR
jgi:hypothetical protein